MVKLLFLLFSLLSFAASAQVGMSTVSRDAEALHGALKTTPSFRNQIKGANRKHYFAALDRLRQDTSGQLSPFDRFQQLATLLFFLRDNHLGFYSKPRFALTRQQLSDSVLVRNYRESRTFSELPRYPGSLDSLERALENLPADSLAGIYWFGRFLKVGLFPTGPGHFIGVVVHTVLPHWQRGQIAIWLEQSASGPLRAIYVDPVWQHFVLVSHERFSYRSLLHSQFYSGLPASGYTKDTALPRFDRVSAATPDYVFRRLSDGSTYVRLGSFQASSQNRRQATSFLHSYRDSVRGTTLTVDLRENKGGAKVVARPFLKWIIRESRKRPVWVLVNSGTMSMGEIVALKLRRKRRILVAGETTMGMIAYGSNFGKRFLLPSGLFEIYLTDMKDWWHRRRYEGRGITPEVLLAPDRAWLEQIAERKSAQ